MSSLHMIIIVIDESQDYHDTCKHDTCKHVVIMIRVNMLLFPHDELSPQLRSTPLGFKAS